nr:immunoglobulin heavy chain junction region [Macaca mulatta]
CARGIQWLQLPPDYW